MTITVLDTTTALHALAPRWDALWRATPGATPFQSPHWLLPWWRAFGTDAPRVVTWHEGGTLAGLLAAYILREPGGAKLLPIGAGTTDYLDALGAGVPDMLAGLLGRAAEDAVPCCDLIELPPGSGLRSAPCPVGWRSGLADGEPCPVLLLSDIPAGIRRKLRMSRHRADRAGGWSVRDATADTLEADFATLAALHGARWEADAEPGVLADPAVLGFHRDAGPGLLAAGLLRLSVLRVAGEVAAAVLALLAPGRIYFYLSGFDTRQRFVSPGTLLLGAMLEQAEAEARTEAHFLRGREAYKYSWGATDRGNATRSFRRDPAAGRAG